MFLRRYERRSGGRRRTYWALVESVRTGRGSRQRVVAYVGELKRSEQGGWAQLGRTLSGKEKPHRSLFDPPHYDDPCEDEPVLVRLRGVRLERLRDFGDVWMAWGLWRLLGLDRLLEKVAPAGREEVPWPVVAALLTMARFCRPQSELHIESTWYRGTALEDLLGVPVEKVHTDRLYGGLDWLLPHKPAIEKHLKDRLGSLFDLEYDLLLYDITSTYFEGQGAANPLAQRGYSRDGRPDCLQVCIGLVVTSDGIPLGYEVFAGNRHDATTVAEIVEAMEQKYGRANRVWVMDRGMVSQENLKFLRARDGQYLVGTPKAMLRQFEEHLTEKDWQEVQEGVEVKLVPGPEGDETFLLARSADRREKEKAMHQRFIERLEEALVVCPARLYMLGATAGLPSSAANTVGQANRGTRKLKLDRPLGKMRSSAESGRLKDEALANRRLGRLLGQYWRAAGAFEVNIERLSPPQGKQRLRVAWTHNRRWSDWAALSEGCYLLRTNLNETDPATLWKRYIQLTEAEWAFRISKDELEIRPIWHQRQDRVLAHILVCFLAYVLWKTLAQWMRRAGLGDAPRTVLEELAKIKSGDVVLPTQTAEGRYNGTLRLRCVTEPDEAQKILLNRLGVTLPRRLRRIDEVAQM